MVIHVPLNHYDIKIALYQHFKFNDETITILDSKMVRVAGSVLVLPGVKFRTLPVEFSSISGDFNVNDRGLTSFKGFPSHIGGALFCSNNHIKTFEDVPAFIKADCYLAGNPFVSLDGCPEYVGGAFNVSWHKDLPLLQTIKYNEILLNDVADDQYSALHLLLDKYSKLASSRSNIIKFQKELIDLGLEGNAKW